MNILKSFEYKSMTGGHNFVSKESGEVQHGKLLYSKKNIVPKI